MITQDDKLKACELALCSLNQIIDSEICAIQALFLELMFSKVPDLYGTKEYTETIQTVQHVAQTLKAQINGSLLLIKNQNEFVDALKLHDGFINPQYPEPVFDHPRLGEMYSRDQMRSFATEAILTAAGLAYQEVEKKQD